MSRRVKSAEDKAAGMFDVARKTGLIRRNEDATFKYTITPLGAAAAGTVMFAAGTPGAVKGYLDNRQGTRTDQQVTTSTPKVPAYAQNGGATGDLVFALNNLRHGGMI